MEYRYTIDDVLDMLNDIYNEIPSYAYNNLNLGVLLDENIKLHEDSLPHAPLYILGQYVKSNLGRQVVIFYGSIMKIYGNCERDYLKIKLRQTLTHELTHHLEDQGREWDLEVDDFINLENYKNTYGNRE